MTVSVLIADDDPFIRRVLGRFLTTRGYASQSAADGQEAWERYLADPSIRCIITDWMMPRLNGLELVRRIRGQEQDRHTYIIMVTGKDQKTEIIEGLENGADDYVKKPFDEDELSVRLRAGVRIIELQERLLAANVELQRLAGTDPLTGMLNRRALAARLQQRRRQTDAVPVPYAFIMADLDHFKHVNDTYGHAVGDMVLRETASRLTANFRTTDYVARIGGEEFFIVAPIADRAAAMMISERARRAISDVPISIGEGRPLSVTISLGVFFTFVGGEMDLEGMMKRADAALYRAKEEGRNRVALICDDPVLVNS